MNQVDPIKSIEEINRVRKLMDADRNYMYSFLFSYGINTGLRISDILSLTFEQLLDTRGRIKSSFEVVEQKTKKKRKILLNKSVRESLEKFLEQTKKREGFVFCKRDDKPVDRTTIWKLLNKYAREAGIKQNIGTHTLRKTFGYHLYKNGIDITRIQYLLNHSAPNITLRYIGITQEEVDDIVENLNL